MNWQFRLNIKPEWAKAKDGKITVQELAKVIAAKLDKIDFGNDDANYESETLVEQFEEISRDETAGRDEFDDVMEELYDFADASALWVSTVI